MDTDRTTAPAPGDPVSWRAVRPGTDVYGSDGERAGSLRAVEGDESSDIFHGLVVATRDREVLVPSDAVATITEDRIDVAMPAASVGQLEEWSAAGASAPPAGEREPSGQPGPPAI